MITEINLICTSEKSSSYKYYLNFYGIMRVQNNDRSFPSTDISEIRSIWPLLRTIRNRQLNQGQGKQIIKYYILRKNL